MSHTNNPITGLLKYPAHGQHRTSNELSKQGIFVSDSAYVRLITSSTDKLQRPPQRIGSQDRQ